MRPELVVFDTDPDEVARLQAGLKLPFILTAIGNGIQVTQSAHLDAMWLTPMQAERYGVSLPFPIHEARLFETPRAEVDRGFPQTIVVGVALSPADPANPRWQLRLVVSAMVRAILAAGRNGSFRVHRVGMLPEHLLLNKLPLNVAAPIIEEA